MSEYDELEYDTIEEAAHYLTGGVLVVPMTTDELKFNFRGMLNYCEEKGISISDLSFEDYNQFEYKPTINKVG